MSGQQHAPAALYPRERTGTQFAGGRVGHRASLDDEKSRPNLECMGPFKDERSLRDVEKFRSCLVRKIAAVFREVNSATAVEDSYHSLHCK